MSKLQPIRKGQSPWDLVDPEETVEVTLDRQRHLYFGANAVEHFFANYRHIARGNLPGAIVGEQFAYDEAGEVSDVVVPVVTAIYHSGLVTEDHTLTRAQVGAMIHKAITSGEQGYRSMAYALALVAFEAGMRIRLLRRPEEPKAEGQDEQGEQSAQGDGPLAQAAETPVAEG